MSKLYSERYVKNQPAKKSVDFIKSSSRGRDNGRIVEAIIVVCIGAIVTCTLGSMVVSTIKPIKDMAEKIQAQEAADAAMYDYILADPSELAEEVLP